MVVGDLPSRSAVIVEMCIRDRFTPDTISRLSLEMAPYAQFGLGMLAEWAAKMPS